MAKDSNHLEMPQWLWATNVSRHLAVKFDFLRPPPLPFPSNQCWFFHFWDSADHTTHVTLNWRAGGIRELNRTMKCSNFETCHFLNCLSYFAAHCSSKVFPGVLLNKTDVGTVLSVVAWVNIRPSKLHTPDFVFAVSLHMHEFIKQMS